MSKGNFPAASLRIGHGYDLHRLSESGKPMVLGGVRIQGAKGVVAHSDGDALLHAITDAILGAIGQPDLGTMAPDTDPGNANANSTDFARKAVQSVQRLGWQVMSIDATVVLESPKIAGLRADIRQSLAAILGTSVHAVNVKGKTHEGLGEIGRGEAIEVHAVALLGPTPTRQD